MGLNPFISRKTLQQLEPLKANPDRKASEAGACEPLHSPSVDQGQDGAMQMEKLRAERLGSTFLCINKSTA